MPAPPKSSPTCSAEDLCHLVGMVMRPGVASYLSAIEYLWYPPGTDRNERYHLLILG